MLRLSFVVVFLWLSQEVLFLLRPHSITHFDILVENMLCWGQVRHLFRLSSILVFILGDFFLLDSWQVPLDQRMYGVAFNYGVKCGNIIFLIMTRMFCWKQYFFCVLLHIFVNKKLWKETLNIYIRFDEEINKENDKLLTLIQITQHWSYERKSTLFLKHFSTVRSNSWSFL